ncbi:hypothetical protein ABZY45_31920 [Streptomyces sp. NPDC006516]|uniref:hypothetical protein n=1 Tax=Streptomyces sp. NPDC006516 TaxID=3154309 RepID=UPI0033BE383E
MSAYYVVGTVGFVVLAGGVAALVMIVRSGLRGPYAPREPTCAVCGHARSHHWKGNCRYERGDTRWGDDSYGTTWKAISTPEICGCTAFSSRRTG